ncbi:MAG: hypothetical protein C0622_13835 [Desulfuromonas sp.]|nr:MAG: hypothetical protein C0622_13835 [Desulfuromonas sp.]
MADELKKPAILLVDDVPLVLDLLEDILDIMDYPVVRAESGDGINLILDQHDIALVFCDIALPGLNGVDLLRMIKQHTPEIQVVMISGKQDFELAREVLRERAFDYLVKPFTQEEVLRVARQGLDTYYHTIRQNQARQEAQRRMTDLILLRKIGETASSGNDLQELFEQMIDSVVQSAEVEIASLMLLKEDGRLRIVSSHGLTDEIIGATSIAPGEGVSGHVLMTGESVLVADISQDCRFSGHDGWQKYKNHSLLSVPIQVRDELVGVINVNNKVSGEPFDLEDQNLMMAIANQVSLAMENFKLVNNLRRQTLALEHSNEELVRLNRARTRLVCNLSHELKTPLTSIMGYIDLSLAFYDKLSSAEHKENLDLVRSEGRHLERLITGMLRLFSIESENEIWRWKSFGVAWPIADALQQYDSRIKEQQLQVELDISDDLPEIYSDQEKFGMALNALIDNAVKFNCHGGVLRIRSEEKNCDGQQYIYLQIFNEGKAVPLDAHEAIFNSFTQLGDIDTEKPQGVGIGLALAKVVVERMRGNIFLEDVAGAGTCFGLLLPTEQTYNELRVDAND